MKNPLVGSAGNVNGVEFGYDVRREYNSMQAESPATSGSFQTLEQAHTFSGHPICSNCTGVTGTDVDANTGGLVNLPQFTEDDGCNVVPILSYDVDGRQWTEFNHQLPAGICPESYTLEDTRTYDAEDRTLTDTGSASNNAMYIWGPSGHLTKATCGPVGSTQTYTFHWDGDDLLFLTDSGGGVDQVNLEHIAFKNGASSSLGWTVFDRDFSGTVVDKHTGVGDAGFAATPKLFKHYRAGLAVQLRRHYGNVSAGWNNCARSHRRNGPP